MLLELDDAATATGIDPLAVRSLPAFLVAEAAHPWADTVIGDGGLDAIVAGIERAPIAAMALVLLLRGAEERSAEDGLVAESTTYSMLQGGPEFEMWRKLHVPRNRVAQIGPAVRVDHDGTTMRLTLSRPHVHNAFSRRVRDELADALTVALVDGGTEVVLAGDGPSFCSGGDLDEFGSFTSPPGAHIVRLTRSPARLMAAIGDRVTVHLHGACMGAGIELPAFAHRVVAAADTAIALPELSLGLVPGAGGTVSLPRRIGRHRTAWLALTGATIDAPTALGWGLVDELV